MRLCAAKTLLLLATSGMGVNAQENPSWLAPLSLDAGIGSERVDFTGMGPRPYENGFPNSLWHTNLRFGAHYDIGPWFGLGLVGALAQPGTYHNHVVVYRAATVRVVLPPGVLPLPKSLSASVDYGIARGGIDYRCDGCVGARETGHGPVFGTRVTYGTPHSRRQAWIELGDTLIQIDHLESDIDAPIGVLSGREIRLLRVSVGATVGLLR